MTYDEPSCHLGMTCTVAVPCKVAGDVFGYAVQSSVKVVAFVMVAETPFVPDEVAVETVAPVSSRVTEQDCALETFQYNFVEPPYCTSDGDAVSWPVRDVPFPSVNDW